jgi:tetratricopeptide (TPR) repeat protein
MAQVAPPKAVVENKPPPAKELTGPIVYQFLLAEIAAQRGQFVFSAGAYLDLAKLTRDPRIVRRAAEIGLHARQYDTALEATRLWLEIEPESTQPRQMESTLLLASGRIDELAKKIATDLKLAGPRAGDTLIGVLRAFARHGDKAVTQRIIDRVTEPYLDLAESHLARAHAAAGVSDAARARAEIDEALRLRPDWELAALFKSDLLTRNGGQLEFLQEFLSAHPAAHDVRLAYARALVAVKRYEAARTEFRRLLDQNANNIDLLYAIGILSLQLDDAADAEQYLTRFVAIGRGEQLDAARFYLGQIADQAGRAEDALRWYREVVSGEQVAPARIRAAQVLVRLGRLDEAREQLAAARSGESGADSDVRLLIAEAQLLRDAGRHADAYALLNKALETQPDDPDLLYETALAAEKLDNMATAERLLRRLMQIKPDSPQGYNALGFSLADRNVRLDEAAVLIDKALALAPADGYILDSKGWLLFRQGDVKAALEILQKAYGMKSDPEIAAHIGEVLWSLGRRDEATRIWRDAAKLNPGNEALTATIKRFTAPAP